MISLAVDDRLNLQFAGVYGAAAFLASLIGLFVISGIIRRSGHASYLVLLLSGLIFVSWMAAIAFNGRYAVENLVHGDNIGFGSYCGT